MAICKLHPPAVPALCCTFEQLHSHTQTSKSSSLSPKVRLFAFYFFLFFSFFFSFFYLHPDDAATIVRALPRYRGDLPRPHYDGPKTMPIPRCCDRRALHDNAAPTLQHCDGPRLRNDSSTDHVPPMPQRCDGLRPTRRCGRPSPCLTSTTAASMTQRAMPTPQPPRDWGAAREQEPGRALRGPTKLVQFGTSRPGQSEPERVRAAVSLPLSYDSFIVSFRYKCTKPDKNLKDALSIVFLCCTQICSLLV
jgi:hypothetical protein